MTNKIRTIFSFLFLAMICSSVSAQFYHGMHQSFGKNRIQYDQFDWQKYEYPDFTVYFYGEGKNLAVYTARHAGEMITEVERFFDYPVRSERLQFIVYHKIEHFRQSNVGIHDASESNIGGITQIADNKIFIYYEGDLNKMRVQIRKGISKVLIAQMLFGDNWRDMIKNNTLLNFPDWYVQGLTSFAAETWSVDADDRLRDIVLRGKYNNFNRLKAVDSEVAGRSLWYYIAETYGTNVIPNIIYMSRVSRNVESGFLFVLGISMKTLLNDAQQYFSNRYEQDVQGTQEFDEFLKVKLKSKQDHGKVSLNGEGSLLAFASNDLGKTKVFIKNLDTGKRKKVFKQGQKLQRIDDFSYPVLAWNNTTGRLLVVTEKKGKIWLYQIDPDKGVEQKSEILRIEKILEMNVSPDGKQILFSAINKGQSDILLYSVAANSYKQLTQDIYDDRYPSFWGNDKVIFSSNRQMDTVNLAKSYVNYAPGEYYDLFSIPTSGKEVVAMPLTRSASSNEIFGAEQSNKRFVFLSDKSGIRNRYSGYIDSSFVSIDTAITYRYFTITEALTGYPRNLRETNFSKETQSAVDVVYFNGRYKFQRSKVDDSNGAIVPPNSNFVINELEPGDQEQKMDSSVADTNGVRLVRIKVFGAASLEKPAFGIDINNYQFEPGSEAQAKENIIASESLSPDSALTPKVKPFNVPEQRNYNLAFAATDLTTQLDYGFATDMYQPFNGGPYVMPGMGSYIKIGMLDVFENYKIDGGFRLSFNRNVNEFFLSMDDRSKRIDKKYVVQRLSLYDPNNVDTLKRSTVYQTKAIYRYPFSETQALQGTATFRYDKQVTLAASDPELLVPDLFNYWLGLKLEYIFDNTFNRALNIMTGARAKVFAEHYRDLINPNTDFTVVGLDARHYKKLHRDLIWANRLAASSSFGSKKLVYYMGGVDNWVVLGNSQERFDQTTNIAQDQDYAFQTIATNMRGFAQNARNGNNMVVFNSELRWPIIRYLTDRPIKNEFLANLQLIGFADVGTAWNGPNPYSDENAFNSIVEESPSLKVTYRNQNDPIIGGLGYGARSKIWGYFVRMDYAWGVENALFLEPKLYFSVGLDF